MDNFKSKQGGFCLLKAKDLIPPLLWKMTTGAQVLQPSTRLSRGSGLSVTESSAGWKQPLRSLSPRQQQVSLTDGLPAHLRKANRSQELPQKPAASDLYSEGAEKKTSPAGGCHTIAPSAQERRTSQATELLARY